MTILKCIFEKEVPCLDCIQLVRNARFVDRVIGYEFLKRKRLPGQLTVLNFGKKITYIFSGLSKIRRHRTGTATTSTTLAYTATTQTFYHALQLTFY